MQIASLWIYRWLRCTVLFCLFAPLCLRRSTISWAIFSEIERWQSKLTVPTPTCNGCDLFSDCPIEQRGTIHDSNFKTLHRIWKALWDRKIAHTFDVNLVRDHLLWPVTNLNSQGNHIVANLPILLLISFGMGKRTMNICSPGIDWRGILDWI
ncbi:hypothetical protein AWV80_33095 [Cupriavidus sp. UYMU48A]|nr:hypothetical protein AWV80_33095 [Cupriavidus sp. UYMU48A]